MGWLERIRRMIREERIRRNLCPEGHGQLKPWEGRPRCWTCGWTPDRVAEGDAGPADGAERQHEKRSQTV